MTIHSSLGRIKQAAALLLVGAALTVVAAESRAPREVARLSQMDLDIAQKKMVEMGWELVYRNAATQERHYWWQESTKTCVSMTIEEKQIKGKVVKDFRALTGGECDEHVVAAREFWSRFSPGQAPMTSPPLDAERQKLSGQGFKVGFWGREVSSGRSVELWSTADQRKCMRLEFSTQTGADIKLALVEPKQCVYAAIAPRK